MVLVRATPFVFAGIAYIYILRHSLSFTDYHIVYCSRLFCKVFNSRGCAEGQSPMHAGSLGALFSMDFITECRKLCFGIS